MAAKTTKAHDELAQLDEAIKAAEQRRNDAHARAAEQVAELQAMLDADGQAFAAGDDTRAEEIRTERGALKEATETWAARVRAVEGTVEQARHARQRFVEEHGDELLAEMQPDADAIVQRVERLIDELTEAIMAFGKTSQRMNGFAHFSRHQPDPVALAQLIPALERAKPVPSPMPKPALVEEEVA